MPDDTLTQIAASLEPYRRSRLEALAPLRRPTRRLLGEADAYHWDAAEGRADAGAQGGARTVRPAQGHRRVRDTLLANTLQFAKGYAANNALLWGARGMGKSSLVKAVHAESPATSTAG